MQLPWLPNSLGQPVKRGLWTWYSTQIILKVRYLNNVNVATTSTAKIANFNVIFNNGQEYIKQKCWVLACTVVARIYQDLVKYILGPLKYTYVQSFFNSRHSSIRQYWPIRSMPPWTLSTLEKIHIISKDLSIPWDEKFFLFFSIS